MIFIKSPDFKEIKQIKEISDFSQYSRDSLPPFGVLISKIMDFKENDLFQENEQNEHISVKLQISVLLSKFQKRALYCLQFLHRKLSIFTK